MGMGLPSFYLHPSLIQFELPLEQLLQINYALTVNALIYIYNTLSMDLSSTILAYDNARAIVNTIRNFIIFV